MSRRSAARGLYRFRESNRFPTSYLARLALGLALPPTEALKTLPGSTVDSLLNKGMSRREDVNAYLSAILTVDRPLETHVLRPSPMSFS
jgi:hypothetical protein